MVVFPNAKINLGLRVLHKRNDGFHELETIFYPVQLNDAFEVIRSKDVTQFRSSGLMIPGSEQKNLCSDAYALVKQKFPDLPPVQMHLHKKIPIGSGLGGGSSDGAFTLTLLNNMFSLGMTTEQLLDLAMQLGSDCPFFIINKPCIGTGRGELLQRIALDLQKYKLILVHPAFHISTKEVFSNFMAQNRPPKSLREICDQPISTWKNELKNDLEPIVFEKYPEIESIKQQLYDTGALYASMTGSGSAVYGIFESNVDPDLKAFESHAIFQV